MQNSSHSPQGAYGYMLSQINPKPRLAVATHFTTADDTVDLALGSVREHVPGVRWEPSGEILDDGVHPAVDAANITWTTDLMVLRVFPDKILVQSRLRATPSRTLPSTTTGTPAPCTAIRTGRSTSRRRSPRTTRRIAPTGGEPAVATE